MAQREDRESLSTDVVIVGAGPAGLAAAIRLKQKNPGIGVTVVEKAAEIGGHILSGAVMNPVGLDALLPDWRAAGAPVGPAVTEDRFHYLTAHGDFTVPSILLPPQMKTKDAVIVSLGALCKWLAGQAEALGVEIYPATAAVDVLTGEDGAVTGIITGDLGRARDGSEKPGFARGVALEAKYTLVAEGARGSLAKALIRDFDLARGHGPQKFALGIKEIWEIPEARHAPGRVDHYLGFPFDRFARGGGFAYHAAGRQLYLGLVVHLDYSDPRLSPFDEFQRFKTHPAIRGVFEGGKRLAYGARAITEGGYQSVPRLSFPGGALIGCAAGFVNVPRIKGVHNAMGTGMQAAEHVAAALAASRANDELVEYENAWRASAVGKDLFRVRNVKPLWSKFGTIVGVALGGIDMWTNTLFGLSVFGTLKHGKTDAQSLEPASMHKPIAYPKPDGVLTFDRLSSVFLSNTNHEEDQPVHLQVKDMALQKSSEFDIYAGPSTRYCPAGVYEWVEKDGKETFVINAQNCVHCKTCDIKDPNQNINWVPPQGGEGPVYPNM